MYFFILKKLAAVGLIFVFFSLSLALPANAESYGCSGPQTGKEAVQHYDLIFKGTVEDVSSPMRISFVSSILEAISSYPRHSTTFKINVLYKGTAKERVTIYQRYANYARYIELTPGSEVTVFAKLTPEGYYVLKPLCRKMVYPISKGGYEDPELNEILLKHKADLEAADKKIAETPELDAYEAKAQLLEDFHDYFRAKETYESLLRNISKQSAVESTKDNSNCSGVYKAVTTDSELLKAFSSFPSRGKSSYLIGYGRVLFQIGKYQEALHPLCLASMGFKNAEASKWLNNTLLVLKLYSELTNRRLDLQAVEAYGVNFANTNIESSDFSDASLGVAFENVKASNAKAQNAKLSGDFLNVDFSNSDFRGAKFEARAALNLNLSKSNFSEAYFSIRAGSAIDLTGADFTNAKIGCLPSAKIDGANFTHSNFEECKAHDGTGREMNRKLDLSNQDLEGSHFWSRNFNGSKFSAANLKRAEFAGASLVGVDFSDANLENANFKSTMFEVTNLSGANFRGANLTGAMLDTAKYDCATKFPEGFEVPFERMVLSGGPCSGAGIMNKPLNFSIEKFLDPPNHHYRLSGVPTGIYLEGQDLRGSNFQGAALGRMERGNFANSNFRYVKYVQSLANNNLEGADFSYSNLKEVIFTWDKDKQPNLKGAKFYCAVLGRQMPSLESADLTAAIFTTAGSAHKWDLDIDPIKAKILHRDMQYLIDRYGAADYSGMDFRNCDLRGIGFGETKLVGAKFKGAWLGNDFRKADLKGADFRGAKMNSYTSKFPADFDMKAAGFVYISNSVPGYARWGATTAGPNYGGETPTEFPVIDFKGENVDYFDYRSAWLPGSNMQDASMKFVNFQSSNLAKVNMSAADLTGAVLYNVVFDDANLSNANLYGADLRKARLKGTDLKGANLRNAIYDKETIWPDGFDPKAAGAYFIAEDIRVFNVPE